jgi:hypothetical protein
MDINKVELKVIEQSLLPKRFRNCLILAIARFIQEDDKKAKRLSNYKLLEIASRLVFEKSKNQDGSFLAVPNENFSDFFLEYPILRITKKRYSAIDSLLAIASEHKGAMILFLPTLKSDTGHAEFFIGEMLTDPRILNAIKNEKHELMMIILTTDKR